MFMEQSDFWWRFLIVIVSLIVILTLFNILMRKIFKVEKKAWFSYNHVNEKHKKTDWAIRISFMVIMLTYIIIIQTVSEPHPILFLQPAYLIFLYLIVSESVRAAMEKKYAENKNDYKFTISQLLMCIVLLGIIFGADPIGVFWR